MWECEGRLQPTERPGWGALPPPLPRGGSGPWFHPSGRKAQAGRSQVTTAEERDLRVHSVTGLQAGLGLALFRREVPQRGSAHGVIHCEGNRERGGGLEK